MPGRNWKFWWRVARRMFRWFRVTCLLLVLAVLCSFLWLNQAGLPAFLKRRIQAELRARGLDLEFSRVRLRWYSGVVAENVALARASHDGPQLTVARAEIRLDPDALRHFEVKVPSVAIRDGKLVWPVALTNEPPRQLVAENLTTELRFLPDDTWELEKFTARVNGLNVTLGGSLAHRGELPLQRQLPASPEAVRVPVEAQLRRVLDQLERVKFAAPPDVELAIRADGRRGGGFEATMHGAAGEVASPWGAGRNIRLTLRLRQPPGTNTPVHADLKLELDDTRTDHFEAGHASFALNGIRSEIPGTAPVSPRFAWKSGGRVELREAKSKPATAAALTVSGDVAWTTGSAVTGTLAASASRLHSAWLDATNAHLTASGAFLPETKQFTNAAAEIHLDTPRSRWAAADVVALGVRARLVDGARTNAAWGWWNRIAPWQLGWNAAVTNLTVTNRTVNELAFAGEWRAPQLRMDQFGARLNGGRLDAVVALDVDSRRAEATGGGDFDLWPLAPLFGTNFVKFLDQFQFAAPPRFDGAVAVTLPAWTNRAPDWKGGVLPTLVLGGHVKTGAGAFRGVTFDAAQADATFSNLVWHLPQIHALRPEGSAKFSYHEDTVTRDYAFAGRANIDPQALRPVLEDARQRRVLDFFKFASPPEVEGEVRGRWLAHDRLGVDARVAATNFTIRGENVGEFAARVNYTNEFFRVTDARLTRTNELGTMPLATVDLRTTRIFVTNVQSTVDPLAFTRVINREAEAAIAPYRFARPPSARVNGSISFREIDSADLHFDVSGGPFAWLKFNVPDIRGQVHWVTNTVVITNLAGGFYGGEMQGDVALDFTSREGADFHFAFIAADADLHRFIGDLASPTNKLEGTFSGVFSVTAGNTMDFKSWQGFGSARLTNGLLWDVPLVGLFSPVFNAIVPGLGSSRAREAKADFTLTNGVIRTANLVIHSPPARLHYDGTVGFDAAVNARVEAELFRDAFLIGPLLSLLTTPITKVFEYKVTGTLTDPVAEPTYVPKLLMIPLRPFHTLKQLIPGLADPPRTPEKK